MTAVMNGPAPVVTALRVVMSVPAGKIAVVLLVGANGVLANDNTPSVVTLEAGNKIVPGPSRGHAILYAVIVAATSVIIIGVLGLGC